RRTNHQPNTRIQYSCGFLRLPYSVENAGICLLQRKPYRQCKCVRNKIDAWNNIQFRLPVNCQIDGNIGEFIIESKDACGPQESFITLKTYIGAGAVKPPETRCIQRLVQFQQRTHSKPRSERYYAFHGATVCNKIFTGNGTVKGRSGVAESNA